MDCKWIFKIKEGLTPREALRYKARLVAKCFTQKGSKVKEMVILLIYVDDMLLARKDHRRIEELKNY